MNKELKPCPFCGGSNTVVYKEDGDYSICCDFRNGGCGSASGYREKEIEAIETWNNRVEPLTEPKPLTVEQLRKMDGQPVWCERLDKKESGWRIVGFFYDGSLYAGSLYAGSSSLEALRGSNYGKTWLAFDRQNVKNC